VLASDCELPFLSHAEPVASPDLTLNLAEAAGSQPGTFWFRAESSVIDRTAAGDHILRFADETEFLVGADGRSISLLAAPSEYTRDDLAAYALGPALILALHLQGAVLLHASAVVMHDKAVLFAGESGSGKSTAVAMLHRLGYRLLSDDVTEVQGNRAFASVPTVRLWPDVLDALYGSAAAFPDRAPSWDKKLVRVEDAADAREIAAILFLEGHEGDARLQRIDARTGWMRLIADAPTARLPHPEMERKIFDTTSAIADRVPMFSFIAPPLEAATTIGELLERELVEWLR
jgi:predicted ATPase